MSRRRSGSLAAACVAALAGCGGAGGGSVHKRPAAPARYLAPVQLERDLGNSFRQGLYRLAVMSQPGDESTDLGQDLQTGLLDRVRCPSPSGAGMVRSTRCVVRWETVDGRRTRTVYAVRDFPTGCFAAGATPAMPRRYDSTTRNYGEHPLNVLVSVRKGC